MAREKPETSKPNPAPSQGPSADEVEAYLRANPDFFDDRPGVLADLTAPARDDGENVLDMQQFMLRRLQTEVTRLDGYQRELLATSRVNQAAQGQVHRAALALLEATGFEHLIHVCTHDLPAILDVDAVTLCVEAADELSPRRARTNGVYVLDPGTVRTLLGGAEAVLLPDAHGDGAIFGPAAGLVRSQALVRVHASSRAPVGLLALGSRDPERFEAGQATELLGFLARLLERLIRGWLELPA
ncbi:MAG: DUF484 family protein [Alphaproteobacteria bacterium]